VLRKFLDKQARRSARPYVKDVMRNLPMTPHTERPVLTPWIVEISYDSPGRDAYFTGVGVLVGPRHVLTCAHIIADHHLPAQTQAGEPPATDKKFFVRVGGISPGSGERHDVLRIDTPGGHAARRVNDVAILVLRSPASASPIRLGAAPATVGEPVSILGWPTDANGPGDLTQVNTTVIDPNACMTARRGQDELCAANLAGADGLKNGYSGGPVIRMLDGDAELVGLCSRGAIGLGDDVPPPAVIVDIAGWHREFVLDRLNDFR
jgi:hypothetical protein